MDTLAADVQLNLNSLSIIASFVVQIVMFIYLIGFRIAKMEVKVDTMWMFQMRRGLVEVEEKGLGRSRSPIRLTKSANDAIAPLLPELKELYEKIGGAKLSAVDLAVAIEQHFGNRLVEVCKEYNISSGACLVLAIGQLRPVGYKTIEIPPSKIETKLAEQEPTA